MALTNAERQARFRAHRAGRHDLCPPERECRTGHPRRRVRAAPALDESVGPGRGAALPRLPETTAAAPSDGHRPPRRPRPLAARSDRTQALWDELAPHLDAAGRVMLLEACRIADRLDRLDAIIDGNDEWLRISTEQGDVIVAVDAALAEARGQATTLRGLLADLAKAIPKGRTGRPPAKRTGGLGDLQARIAARRSAAQG